MNCLKESLLKKIVKQALREDIGKTDITTRLLVPKNKIVKADILAKQDCLVCGLKLAKLVFLAQDKNIRFQALTRDGEVIKKGKVLVKVQGKARAILTAERVALNFLSLLSGIATKTRGYVEKIKPYGAKIMDTRKTIPRLRALEKYAVKTGGGYNHRFSLDEMVMVKDNHLKIIGDRLWGVGFREIKNKHRKAINIEVEVKTLKEFRQALKIAPDIIMLDNMGIKDIKKAVSLRNKLSPNKYKLTPKLEASGGITLKNVKKVAACGVEMISVGALTQSVKAIDISLEVL